MSLPSNHNNCLQSHDPFSLFPPPVHIRDPEKWLFSLFPTVCTLFAAGRPKQHHWTDVHFADKKNLLTIHSPQLLDSFQQHLVLPHSHWKLLKQAIFQSLASNFILFSLLSLLSLSPHVRAIILFFGAGWWCCCMHVRVNWSLSYDSQFLFFQPLIYPLLWNASSSSLFLFLPLKSSARQPLGTEFFFAFSTASCWIPQSFRETGEC